MRLSPPRLPARTHSDKLLSKKIEDAKKLALANKKDKSKAMFYLKKKKMYDTEQSRLQATMLNLEQSIQTLEQSTLTAQTFQGLQQGARALQGVHQDVGDVEDVMEDVREQFDMQNEIADAITQPLGEEMDEDEMLAELDALGEEETEEQLLNTPVMPAALPAVAAPAPAAPVAAMAGMGLGDLPAAPTTALPAAPVAAPDPELDDLRALEASMGMS